jgi:hypothetical protein
MWLVLAVAAPICDPPSQRLSIRVVDPNGAVVPGAEVRKWSGREPREALLGVTESSGSLAVCVSPGTGPLGVYVPGFRPRKLIHRAGQIVVTLEIATPTISAVAAEEARCVTGSAKDGSYRFCGDVLSRLPLRN